MPFLTLGVRYSTTTKTRTRFENPSINAYYVKMDLNLVGKQADIVTDFGLMPDVHNLCTMTYDIDTKTVLVAV